MKFHCDFEIPDSKPFLLVTVLEHLARSINNYGAANDGTHSPVFDGQRGVVIGFKGDTLGGWNIAASKPELPEDTPAFTFNGIAISISAPSAAAAYSELCETIPDSWYFETDTYRGADGKDADTSELFPCECGRPRVMCATFDYAEAEHTDRFPEPEDANTLTDEALIAGGVSAVALEVLADQEGYGKDWELRREMRDDNKAEHGDRP